MIDKLKDIDPRTDYWYVATPYTKYAQGLYEANRMACKTSGWLTERRVPLFSPIAHSHALCMHYHLSPLDHGLWMGADYPLMHHAHGLVVVKANGWQRSDGVQDEIQRFKEANKPIHYIEPVEGL